MAQLIAPIIIDDAPPARVVRKVIVPEVRAVAIGKRKTSAKRAVRDCEIGRVVGPRRSGVQQAVTACVVWKQAFRRFEILSGFLVESHEQKDTVTPMRAPSTRSRQRTRLSRGHWSAWLAARTGNNLDDIEVEPSTPD